MAYRGSPILTLRMPREFIEGLQQLAHDQNTTVSDIVRDLVKGKLDQNHIATTPKPLDGQIRV